MGLRTGHYLKYGSIWSIGGKVNMGEDLIAIDILG